MGNIFWSKGSAPGKDDTTRGVKRKTCPDSLTPIKRKRSSDYPTTSKECFSASGVKRKATEDGEPTKEKENKGRLGLNLFGKESASSSNHSGKGSAPGKDDTTRGVKRKTCPYSLTPIKRKWLRDYPTTSKECFSASGVKRKATEDGEPTKKKENKGRLGLNLFGKESASSSKHSGKGSAPGKDDTTRGVKRKTCPYSLTPIKRKWLRDYPTTSEECFSASGVKRKATEDGEPTKKKENKGRLGLNLFGKEPASSSKHSGKGSAPGKDDTTRGVKRKTCPDSLTPIKRKRSSDYPTTSKECFSASGVKRKATEDGEPTKKKDKKGRLGLNLFGKESASSSKHSGKESCTTSVRKRKATADDNEGPKTKRKRTDLKKTRQSLDALIAEFGDKYKQQDQLGKGGGGTVFGGYRKADNLPVAIKHIPKQNILYDVDGTGKRRPVELAIMLKLGDKTSRSVGMSVPVSLLDWYDLDKELILVMERPIPAEDLHHYNYNNGGSLPEQEAKIILKQLVDAAIDLEKENIFHRDIKCSNILIEASSDVPRVRLIDFGVSCFDKRSVSYSTFRGTPAYSPPEWCYRRRYRAGPTTVWQIGVVLFETLHSDTFFDTKLFLKNCVEIRETLSKNCLDFLLRCLTVDPKQRPTLEQLRIHPWLTEN